MTGRADGWIRWTTTGCVALPALIAGTVSYLHMHRLVALHGQPGWVASLTPLSVDGMIVAASATLLAGSRAGRRGGALPWALLVAGSVASLAANVAVAGPSLTGRVIAAWPSFALTALWELLTRQVRRSAPAGDGRGPTAGLAVWDAVPRLGSGDGSAPLRELQRQAWRWALANRAGDGTLPAGSEIARQYGRRERWGRPCQERRAGRRVRGHHCGRRGRRRDDSMTCCIVGGRDKVTGGPVRRLFLNAVPLFTPILMAGKFLVITGGVGPEKYSGARNISEQVRLLFLCPRADPGFKYGSHGVFMILRACWAWTGLRSPR